MSSSAASSTESTADAADAPDEELELVPLTEIGHLLKAGMDAHRSGRLEDAAKAYQALLDLDPGNPDGLHLHGMLMAQTGKLLGGHELLLKAVAAAPAEPMFHNNLGNVLMGLERYDEAEAAYRQAVALDSERFDARNNLAVLLRRKRDFDAAEKTYLELLEAAPGFTDARQNLAQMYLSLGRINEAVQQCAIGLVTAPRNPGMRHILGMAYCAMGWHDEAVELYTNWLKDEPDNPIAIHHHAGHSGKNVPDQASELYVRHTFDSFAFSFDAKLAALEYCAPELVAGAVAATLGAPQGQLRVADAGCGTGLCAPHLAPYAKHLVGVDLSGGMLQRAAERKLYHDLVREDLTAFLQARPASFELLVSADTLCYFGRIDAFAAAAQQSLTPGGLLVFTVEASDPPQQAAAEGTPAKPAAAPKSDAGWHLQGHGRYSHRRDYVLGALTAAGFVSPTLEPVVLRQENQLPVHGWLVQAKTP